MRLTALRFTAIFSCLALLGTLSAARRPRYGGTLRIELATAIDGPDPADLPARASDAVMKEKLLGGVFETLVQLDDKGEPKPWLATSWKHDAQRRKWLFTVREKVALHNGLIWDPPGGAIAVDDRQPIEEILRNLAKPQNAIVVREEDGRLTGSGPFRIAKWEPKRMLVLEAYDNYWGGRPFLDRVEVRFGRSPREQAVDLELGKAEAVELPLSEVRRVQQRGGHVAVSPPVETVALVFDQHQPEWDRIQDALALCLDRSTIYNVLLQKQGEISGALLPQWLSGYAFLFDRGRDMARAKELAAGAPSWSFGYDRENPVLRAIAERMLLNAGEAGIALRPAGGEAANVRLVSLRVRSLDARVALEGMAAALGVPRLGVSGSNPASLYAAEHSLIESRKVVPLFHLPVAYELSAQVRNWAGDRWHLEDVWMDDRAKP